MNSKTSLRGIAELLWARRYLVAGITLSAVTAAMLFSFFLPRRYESSARLGVAGSRDFDDAAGRAAEIRSELLARAGAEGTVVEVEKTAGGIVLRVTGVGSDPEAVKDRVDRLARGYEDAKEAAAANEAGTELAEIRNRLAAARDELEDVSGTLTAFETEHAEQRFGETNDTPTRLAEARSGLESAAGQVELLEKKLADIRDAFAAEPELVEVVKTLRDEERVAKLEKEIRDAEAALALLRRRYTEEHDEVVALVDLISRRNRDLAAAKAGEKTVTAREPNPVRAELRDSERAVESELLVKRRFAEEFEARVATLEKQVQAYPGLVRRWQELGATKASLAKEIAGLETRETEVATVHERAKTASAVRFETIEPAVLPDAPTSPNRTLIALLGLLLGFGASLGIVGSKSLLDRSFGSPEAVAAAFDIPVLGAISRIETLGEREAAKRKRRLAAVAVAVLFVFAGLTAFLQVKYDGPITSLLQGTAESGR